MNIVLFSLLLILPILYYFKFASSQKITATNTEEELTRKYLEILQKKIDDIEYHI